MSDWDKLLGDTRPANPSWIGALRLDRDDLPADVRKLLDDPARPRPATRGAAYAITEAIVNQCEVWNRRDDRAWLDEQMENLGLVPAREPNGFGRGFAWSWPSWPDEFFSGDYKSCVWLAVLHVLQDEAPQPQKPKAAEDEAADLLDSIPVDDEWRGIPELTVLLSLSDRATRDQVRAWVHAGELEVTEQATGAGGRPKKLYRRPS